MGRMKSVRNTAVPRTGRSSARASAMPSAISALTHTAANSSVVHSEDHTRALENAETKLSRPVQRASLQGVPMLQSCSPS